MFGNIIHASLRTQEIWIATTAVELVLLFGNRRRTSLEEWIHLLPLLGVSGLYFFVFFLTCFWSLLWLSFEKSHSELESRSWRFALSAMILHLSQVRLLTLWACTVITYHNALCEESKDNIWVFHSDRLPKILKISNFSLVFRIL